MFWLFFECCSRQEHNNGSEVRMEESFCVLYSLFVDDNKGFWREPEHSVTLF